MSDGALARSSGRVTVFGGFLDSVLDRYTDLLVTGSIFYFFITHGSIYYASVTFIAVVGTAIIPYARARAEAAGVPCRSGLLERPERTILLIVGLLVPLLLHSIVVVLAVLTHVTVIQRVLYVMKKIKV
jgi:CDP-diacylglycerol--glycerol-3-phosphate 3-phosphatidyltransferase